MCAPLCCVCVCVCVCVCARACACACVCVCVGGVYFSSLAAWLAVYCYSLLPHSRTFFLTLIAIDCDRSPQCLPLRIEHCLSRALEIPHQASNLITNYWTTSEAGGVQNAGIEGCQKISETFLRWALQKQGGGGDILSKVANLKAKFSCWSYRLSCTSWVG